MADHSAAKRVAHYLSVASQMRARAEAAFDPQIAASYLELAAKWLRLAEQAQRGIPVIDRRLGPRKPNDGVN